MSELLTALGNLTANYEELAAVTLFSIGLCMLLFARNLIKKVIGLDIMDTGVFLLLASRGYISGRTVPIITDGVTFPTKICGSSRKKKMIFSPPLTRVTPLNRNLYFLIQSSLS